MTEAILRVVVDPNVYVSSLISPNGTTGVVVREGLRGRFRFAVSPHLLSELDEVLRRPTFRRWFTEEEVAQFLVDLDGNADSIADPPSVPALTRDPDDDYLLALAEAAGADALVSGDDDLTALNAAPVEILTPRQLLDRLDQP